MNDGEVWASHKCLFVRRELLWPWAHLNRWSTANRLPLFFFFTLFCSNLQKRRQPSFLLHRTSVENLLDNPTDTKRPVTNFSRFRRVCGQIFEALRTIVLDSYLDGGSWNRSLETWDNRPLTTRCLLFLSMELKFRLREGHVWHCKSAWRLWFVNMIINQVSILIALKSKILKETSMPSRSPTSKTGGWNSHEDMPSTSPRALA